MTGIEALDFSFKQPAKKDLETALFCLFRNGEVLVRNTVDGQTTVFHSYAEANKVSKLGSSACIGKYPEHYLLADNVSENAELPSDFQTVSLIRFFMHEPVGQAQLVGRGAQLLNWRKTHQYCGTCGSVMSLSETEQAMLCGNCQSSTYPRISPCIITLITRGEEFLLARSAQSRAEWYSTLAGFVEPGESLSQTLKREVFEEVGLQVGKITYIDSQPWPFPAQLMVGFLAEYASGEIQVDGEEILEADWFTADNLPPIPGNFSIAGQLINGYINSL